MTIWKFPLKIIDEQIIMMPRINKIISVQVQQKVPCLWAIVNPDDSLKIPVKIVIIGTGHIHPSFMDMDFIGSIQLHEGNLVLHVFKDKNG